MTKSLAAKVASSSPVPDPKKSACTMTDPDDDSPPAEVIQRTEVIRRFPSKVKKVIIIEDEEEDKEEDSRLAPGSLPSTLDDQLYGSRLLNLPGLIEHLFPDRLLPIPFDSLKFVATTKLWDSSKQEWRDHDPASATFFNCLSGVLINAALTHPYYSPPAERSWSSECYTPPYGATVKSKCKRRYGINLVDKKKTSSATWSTIVINVERRSKAYDASEALERLTEAAAMIFHHQPDRRFIISLSICGNEFRVYVFDRAGLVGSEPFHLKKDSDSLVRLMAGLVLTGNDSLGFDPSITVQVEKTGRISRTALAGGQVYQLIKSLYVSHDLTGRGSVIWHARRGNADYVIKDTWVDASTPQKEADLLRELKGVEGITQLVSEENMKLYGGRVDDTSHLRRFIAGLKDFEDKECYSNLPVLVHNRIVTTPFAQPLRTFKSKRELLMVLIDAIECHLRLVEKKIMHCDISSSNVLIHRESPPDVNPFVDPLKPVPDSTTPPPRAKGILIDLDSAVVTHDDDGNPTKEALRWANFTGTIPYASVEVLMGLLPGQIREAHHDLESFFYILLWFSLRYAGPNGIKRTDFDIETEGQMRLWVEGGNRGDTKQVGEAKYTTMTTTRAHFRRVVTGKCTPYFQDLIPCIEELWLKFFPKDTGSGDAAGYAEDVRPKVIHQEVIDILRKPLEWLPDVDEIKAEIENKGIVAEVPIALPSHLPVKRKHQDHEEKDDESGLDDADRCPSAKRPRLAGVISR